jgi:metal-responsive CopG/Arc/MetJ family transcriptional regulator
MEVVMSRILVDLPDSQVEELAVLVEAEQRPRAAVIRDAIEAYISQHKAAFGVDVFGVWKSRKVDGLEYQQELRSEW